MKILEYDTTWVYDQQANKYKKQVWSENGWGRASAGQMETMPGLEYPHDMTMADSSDA